MPNHSRREAFVTAGEPVAVMGSATKDMVREGPALIILPDGRWGSPLFADRSLNQGDFHIHASLTLDKLEGSGASFLLGGHYHYPCSQPHGNLAFRISLDDDIEVHNRDRLDTGVRIVCGQTGRRAPWTDAEKVVAAKAPDHIQPGKPFQLDWVQKGEDFSFRIDGCEILHSSLGDAVSGPSDGGWPICFGFLPDRGLIRLHDFWAEGDFCRPELEHTDVWSMGHDGYWTYRIPSLCVTPEGSLLAFAEARRFDFTRWDWRAHPNADEVHCVMKRSADGGITWSGQQVVLASGRTYEARDPSPVVDHETGELFLLTRGPYLMKAENDGETWSEPRWLDVLPEGIGAFSPGPCRGIQLTKGNHKGRLVVPVYGRRGDSSICGVIYSDDHGKTWGLGGMTVPATAEPQLVELSDGRLMLNSRTKMAQPGRHISISSDGGASFSDHRLDASLPSAGCEASLMSTAAPARGQGDCAGRLLFCGPAEGRRKLTVKMSDDDGGTWPTSLPIYPGCSAYSAAALLPDGHVGILYERDAYRRLSLVRLPLDLHQELPGTREERGTT